MEEISGYKLEEAKEKDWFSTFLSGNEDKNQFGEYIYANFRSLIQPLINQLRNSLKTNVQKDILKDAVDIFYSETLPLLEDTVKELRNEIVTTVAAAIEEQFATTRKFQPM